MSLYSTPTMWPSLFSSSDKTVPSTKVALQQENNTLSPQKHFTQKHSFEVCRPLIPVSASFHNKNKQNLKTKMKASSPWELNPGHLELWQSPVRPHNPSCTGGLNVSVAHPTIKLSTCCQDSLSRKVFSIKREPVLSGISHTFCICLTSDSTCWLGARYNWGIQYHLCSTCREFWGLVVVEDQCRALLAQARCPRFTSLQLLCFHLTLP